MTEKELIAAGFKKQEANHLETGNGYDYHYYTLKVTSDIMLISSDSDQVNHDFWIVKSFDISELYIEDFTVLQEFINAVRKVLK
jgi:hypothetical protein